MVSLGQQEAAVERDLRGRHFAKDFSYVNSHVSSHSHVNSHTTNVIVPILQMEKVNHVAVAQFI